MQNPYDAWYVALAEAPEAGLATLDEKPTRAAGPRCAFLTPHGGGSRGPEDALAACEHGTVMPFIA